MEAPDQEVTSSNLAEVKKYIKNEKIVLFSKTSRAIVSDDRACYKRIVDEEGP